MSDKMREAFEATQEDYLLQTLDNGNYMVDETQYSWEDFQNGWQAALFQQPESETVTTISGYECPAMIYLLDMGTDGVSWCEDPAPGDDMDEREAVKYIRSDVICRPPSSHVPEGWQLVPLEPTEHMKDCGYSAMPGVPEDGEETAVYKAMLTAAPSPEVQS